MSQARDLALSGKSRRSFRTSRLIEERRTRRHDTWKRDAMDAERQLTSAAMRTAKSCGPGIPVLMPSPRCF